MKRLSVLTVLLLTCGTGSVGWTVLAPAPVQAQAQRVSFIARRDFDAGSNPLSVAVGDFNGDGRCDLAVANDTSPGTVSVLINNTPSQSAAAFCPRHK